MDNMTVEQLRSYLREHWLRIKEELLTGSYQPQPVLKVEIPKPGGKGMRMLGIPTVVDRLIQQALHQVLSPLFEPNFSESSYGFRPQRSAQQAVLKARAICARRAALGRRHRLGEVLRPSQPRHLDVAVGTANQRQASAAPNSQIPASRHDVEGIDDSADEKERHKVGHSRRCCRTFCSTSWTRSWNDAVTSSAATLMTATSTCGHEARESE